MTTDTVGIDIGPVDKAAERAPWAREVGAAVVRLHLRLAGHPSLDDDFLAAARAAVAAARATGARVHGVVGPEITVAPSGLGAFDEPPGPLAGAWEAEWEANLGRLAVALGDDVDAWELLPAPNRRGYSPGRWARQVALGAAALARGGATGRVVAGGVACSEPGEAAAYLTAAVEHGGADLTSANLWAVGMLLEVLPDGGPDEPAVATAARAAAEQALAAAQPVLDTPRLAVTEVSWAADRVGDEVQARNLWASFNALSSVAGVAVVVWRALVDDEAEVGLLAGSDGVARRSAWQSFNDFSLYARQISPPPVLALEPAAGDGDGRAAGLSATAVAKSDGASFTLHVPSAAEVLAGLGLEGAALGTAREELTRRYGPPEALGPGDYVVGTTPATPEAAAAAFTNQDIISAFYRVGEGSWTVFERSGLSLGDLAARRGEPYAGPPVTAMTGLTDAERALVAEELALAR